MRCTGTVRWLLIVQLINAVNAWVRNDSLECWVIACFVFVAMAFCTMVIYPAFVLYCEKQEERNDDWKENYVPEYPRVRWHLDEYMLAEELKNRPLPDAPATNPKDIPDARSVVSVESKATELKINELHHMQDIRKHKAKSPHKGNNTELPTEAKEKIELLKKVKTAKKKLQPTEKKIGPPKKEVEFMEKKVGAPEKGVELVEKKIGTSKKEVKLVKKKMEPQGKVTNLLVKKQESQMKKPESPRRNEKSSEKKAKSPLKKVEPMEPMESKLEEMESTRRKTDSSEMLAESSTQDDESKS